MIEGRWETSAYPWSLQNTQLKGVMGVPKNRDALRKKAKSLYLKGSSIPQISDKTGVPAGTIRRWMTEDKWKKAKDDKFSEIEKQIENKGGAPKGNQNGLGGKGNPASQYATSYALFAKYIPQETLDLMGITNESSPLDILWTQILLANAALMRAQRIAYVADQNDVTKEITKEELSDTGEARSYEVQQAWDKHGNFMAAQARAQAELRQLIKQYDELLHNDWELATEEQKARIAALKAKANDTNDDRNNVVIVDNIPKP